MKEKGTTHKREYEQKYTLPDSVQADRVTWTINAEGVLTIIAPKGKTAASTMNQAKSVASNERLMPIKHN